MTWSYMGGGAGASINGSSVIVGRNILTNCEPGDVIVAICLLHGEGNGGFSSWDFSAISADWGAGDPQDWTGVGTSGNFGNDPSGDKDEANVAIFDFTYTDESDAGVWTFPVQTVAPGLGQGAVWVGKFRPSADPRGISFYGDPGSYNIIADADPNFGVGMSATSSTSTPFTAEAEHDEMLLFNFGFATARYDEWFANVGFSAITPPGAEPMGFVNIDSAHRFFCNSFVLPADVSYDFSTSTTTNLTKCGSFSGIAYRYGIPLPPPPPSTGGGSLTPTARKTQYNNLPYEVSSAMLRRQQ